MIKKIVIANIVALLMCINVSAQEKEKTINKTAQVTFAYPLGTDGVSSLKYKYNLSLNILYGLNGGLNGIELAGILNYNKGEVDGIQLSGISNICNNSVSGIITSGVLNFSRYNFDGIQIAGVANISGKQSSGFSIAGVSNICADATSGFVISGVMNFAKSESDGLQLSTINIVADKVSGFQLGVINFAKTLDGLQIGVINVSKNIEKGIPIGVISIVKNGYYAFEITGGDAIFANLNYKMGVERFYNIFKVGCSTFKGKPVYTYGMGFGSLISFSDKHKMSIDLSSNSIVYDNDWKNHWGNELNMLNKADINYQLRINKNLWINAGPSFNVYLTKYKIDDEFGTLKVPYTIFEDKNSKRKISMWIGFNVGISLKI